MITLQTHTAFLTCSLHPEPSIGYIGDHKVVKLGKKMELGPSIAHILGPLVPGRAISLKEQDTGAREV